MHVERVAPVQPVVGCALIAGVDSHADKVSPLQHRQLLEVELDESLAGHSPQVHTLEAGVRAVGGEAAVVVNREAENGVGDRLVGAVSDPYLHVLSRVEIVYRLVLFVQQRDTDHLDLAGAALAAFLPGLHELVVVLDDIFRLALPDDVPLVEHDDVRADLAAYLHVVGDEDDRLALVLYLLDALDAFALERFVPDGEHLVDYQDVRVHVDRHCEPQSYIHPARVVADVVVDEAVSYTPL